MKVLSADAQTQVEDALVDDNTITREQLEEIKKKAEADKDGRNECRRTRF